MSARRRTPARSDSPRRNQEATTNHADSASVALASATRSRYLWALAIVVAGLLAYANAIGHPLVLDDKDAIVENVTIRSVADSWRGGPVQSPTAGRPLVNVTFALNYALGGVSPAGVPA